MYVFVVENFDFKGKILNKKNMIQFWIFLKIFKNFENPRQQFGSPTNSTSYMRQLIVV